MNDASPVVSNTALLDALAFSGLGYLHGPHWPRTSRKSVISTSPLRVTSAVQEPGMAGPTVTADRRARRRW